MTNPGGGSRHLTEAGFESFMAQKVPFHIPVSGDPPLTLFLHPTVPEIGLRAPATEVLNHGVVRRGVRLRSVHAGTIFNEVVVNDAVRFKEGYFVLCAIADRVQLDKMSLSEAVDRTLRNLRSLIEPESVLSREASVGLFGELLVLRAAVAVLGQSIAFQSWTGPFAEEHDFRFPDFDLEVKTTTRESRKHWINGLHQLTPSKDRDLWLVSSQITSAPPGVGRSLADLVEDLRTCLSSDRRAQFNDCLERLGWADEGPTGGLSDRWSLRTESRGFPVKQDFPRITSDKLAEAGHSASRLPEVKYVVDLNGYMPSAFPVGTLRTVLENVNR